MPTQIGVQMYTLRDFCKTPADIAKTCKKLADLGFGAVQTSALGPIDVKELRKILDDNGLVCAATHVNLDEMKDTQACIDYHQTLGCELTAIGGFGWNDEGKAEWDAFIAEYNQIGKALAAGGVKLGYHNHNHEFRCYCIPDEPAKLNPKDTIYQQLVDRLDPSIWFEVDTFWIQAAGADPALWIDKLKGRLPALHVKDMCIGKKREQIMCEIGSGNLNWPAILAAAKRAGVQWYLIERDNGLLDPFDSLKISLENMKAMGLS